MQEILYADLGSADYKQTWDFQEQLLQQIMQLKLEGRNQGFGDHAPTPHYLLFCEHPHVFTLGKSGKPEHLLSNEQQLKNAHATYYKINRGGDITYHGPGQVVGYPILNLDLFFNDIHHYMRLLEEVIIRTLNEYGIVGSRIEKLTGVWIDAGKPSARKICAFGVRCSRWITMHGWALKVNTQIDYFNDSVPYAISNKLVTCKEKELGKNMNLDEVKSILLKHFSEVFNASIKNVGKEKLIVKERT